MSPNGVFLVMQGQKWWVSNTSDKSRTETSYKYLCPRFNMSVIAVQAFITHF